jgi:roadblock/LC7 domain-containing protein
MSLISQLARMPGVLAAGEYSYRGDRFSYQGLLDEEQARQASIMCRANTLGINMQAGILTALVDDCGCAPPRGWLVRGGHFTVCVIGNVFCFLDNETASLNEVMRRMRSAAGEPPDRLV